MTKQKTFKMLAMLLVFVLCFAFIPITVTAAGSTEEIIVNNVNIVTAPNYTVQCGEGTAVYNPSEKTLTLNEAEITVGAIASSSSGERYAIAVKAQAIDKLKIILNGNNSITLSDTQYKNMGIWSTDSDLQFVGGGSLNISLYNDFFPNGISATNLEFDNVKIVCNQLNSQKHCGYAIRTDGNVIAKNTSFEALGFETAINSYGTLTMKSSSLKAVCEAEYGMGAFTGEMLIENSTLDIQVPDTGLYGLGGDITVDSSVIKATNACVGMYTDYGNITINGNSKLDLNSTLYGLRIYEGKLTVNNSDVNAIGSETLSGIQIITEKGSKTEPPIDSIVLDDQLTEINGGKIATREVMWDNSFDPIYPVYITTFIPKDDDGLKEDLSNALTAVNIKIKSADYTAVDKAIAEANKLNKDLYKDLSAVEKAVKAVVRDKDISEQAAVDSMAKAINDAIAAAVKKEAAIVTNIADISKTYDGKAVTITDKQYKYNGDGEIKITWYADNKGVKGEKIDAPTKAGTYWVGISASMTDNYLAAEEVYKSFTIKEKELSPQTGDNSNICLWIALLCISGFIVIRTAKKVN